MLQGFLNFSFIDRVSKSWGKGGIAPTHELLNEMESRSRVWKQFCQCRECITNAA
jgi:hypothetical protein